MLFCWEQIINHLSHELFSCLDMWQDYYHSFCKVESSEVVSLSSSTHYLIHQFTVPFRHFEYLIRESKQKTFVTEEPGSSENQF